MLAGQLGLLLDAGFFGCCAGRVWSPSTLFLYLLVSRLGPSALLVKTLPNKPLPHGGLLELLADTVTSIRKLVTGLLELLADVIASIGELAGLLMAAPVLVANSSGRLILGSPSQRRCTA
jgi:hypothetical protein